MLNRYCEEGMIEAVTTLMWSAPRLQTDVQELRVVSLCTNIVLSVSYVGLCLSVFDKIMFYKLDM